MFTDYYTFSCACIGLFIYLDGYYMVKNGLIKFNKLNRLVAIEHTGVINVLFISMYIVFNMLLTSVINQFVIIQSDQTYELGTGAGYVQSELTDPCVGRTSGRDSLVETLECGNYLVSYVIDQTVYKMFVKKKKGPKKVLLIHDDQQSDVSELIFPYLGPNDNFHGIKYTPKFFNKKELIFEFSNGDERIFRNTDEICLE